MPSRPLSWAAIPVLIFSLCVLTGCGKKGPLKIVQKETGAAPSLTYLVHREDGIILQWDFPAALESSVAVFEVLRSSGDSFERIGGVDSSARSFTDTGFTPANRYCYKIEAQYTTQAPGADSNSRCVTPSALPPAPVNLSYRIGDGVAFLDWQSAGTGVSYNVYRSLVKGKFGPAPLNNEPMTGTTYQDTLFIDRPVYYTVRSVVRADPANESGPSAEIVIDPKNLIPGPPEDVTCNAGDGRVYLLWKAPAEKWVTGFRVYRRADGQQYILIGQTEIPAFLDVGGPAGKREYRITAVGPLSEGPASEAACTPFIKK